MVRGNGMRKKVLVLFSVLAVAAILAAPAYCAETKIGYVDLRRSFYGYDKTKNLENNLNDLTKTRQDERAKKIELVTKLRDEAEMLNGPAKTSKQNEIDAKLDDLKAFDMETRQTLLNKKNDMFREVIDDIQKVVENIGKKEGYSYIMDSRYMMFAKEEFDLTNRVITELNGKKSE
ncbi:MAG: OmpH family outer membrane protein [Candidatus Omnitrophota bacterium]